RLGLFTGAAGGGFIPRTATVIQVDIEPEEVGRNRDGNIGIAADAREMMRAMTTAAAGRSWRDLTPWAQALRGRRSMMDALFGAALQSAAPPVHPYRLARDVASFLDRPDDVLVADGGETSFWAEMASTVRRGGHWMSHGYLGCLGTGIPFAIAAQVAHPHSRVVCVTGDGSVGLNFAEFDTLARHKLPVVVVVNNDQQWGMSKHGQELMFGRDRTVVSELGVVRYDLAAAGFGCHAELVDCPADVAPALERAFASRRPACINVLTDPDVIAPITVAMVGGMSNGKEPSANTVKMPYYGDRELV
ncbi:MAG TPA: thiamine pyrophosphate-dependent enzyme, partial [Dehalococcoidia bacterium]|nr:thiamine pyrophosphate-dependent enzyme [Dehalococcoidia bacterium]